MFDSSRLHDNVWQDGPAHGFDGSMRPINRPFFLRMSEPLMSVLQHPSVRLLICEQQNGNHDTDSVQS
jgi:hypothetical protein